MQANEIRIGNLIKWKDESHEMVQITAIYLDKEMDNKEYYTISFVNPNGITENDGTAWLDDFIGIPLTKKWLINFGFGEAYENTFFLPKHSSFDVYMCEGSSCKLFYDNIDLNISLEYVHQLQNLYYALTGEELEYQPS